MICLDCFDVFPRLETARFELRRITASDAEALFEIFSDARVMRYWGSAAFTTVNDALELVAKIERAYIEKEGIEWGIVEKSSGRLIGKCCYHKLYKTHFRAEIGYGLSPTAWGGGRMVEVLSAMIAYGFDGMDLHSVEAQVDPNNERSLATLGRLGFVKEGHLRENFYFAGKFYDTAILSLLRPARASLDGAGMSG